MKTRFLDSAAMLAIPASLISASPAAAADLVTNGGFENGLSGWTYQDFTTDSRAYAGNQAAYTGCGGHACVSTLNSGSYIDQILSTTTGQSYNLSFYVGQTNGPTSEFSVFWNGSQIADVLNPAPNSHPFSLDASGYVLFSYTGLLATSAATDLQIHGREDPAGGILFDNVSVTATAAPVAAVPEPASWAMMIVGFGMIGAGLRYRQRRTKLRYV